MDSKVEVRIESWPIDKLVPYARNPRKIVAAVDRMCGSIRQFGFRIPLLVRGDGEVIDGHLRLKAAHKLGSWPGGDSSQIPVILCDDWTPQQVKAFRLLVNRSVTWADWDEELLSLELQELNAAEFDLSLSGFHESEITRLLDGQDPGSGLVDEDAVPEILETTVSARGDLWILGPHRLLVGDATDSQDVNA